jgi:hypothetical protein
LNTKTVPFICQEKSNFRLKKCGIKRLSERFETYQRAENGAGQAEVFNKLNN